MSSWFARFYDLLYAGKDYPGEAERITTLIRERFPGAASLLDVACGTGRHLEHLQASFSCEGVDLDQDLLDIAHARSPTVRLTQADMVGMSLGRSFDAVICLFSAIGYVQSRSRMTEAVASMASHLNPGGVLIVEPWVLAENWLPGGTTFIHSAELGQDKVVRVSATHRQDDLSVLNFHYVWASPGKITSGDECHLLGLFSRDDYLNAFAEAGLDAKWDEEGLIGRGLVIGLA